MQSWDTATTVSKTSAYSVCLTFGIDKDGVYYLLDCFRRRLTCAEVLKSVEEKYQEILKKYYSSNLQILVENHSSGTQIIQELTKSEKNLPIIKVNPKGTKEERLYAVSHHLTNSACLFPNNNPSWYADFEDELLGFPNSKFADQVDALTQALLEKDSIMKKSIEKKALIANSNGFRSRIMRRKPRVHPMRDKSKKFGSRF